MISVDTNVLLRYLLQDTPEQSRKANSLFEGEQKILLTDIALVETIWTLKGIRYKLPKETLVKVLYSLIEEPKVYFEDGHAVWCALDDYINTSADFADALILSKSQRYKTKNKDNASPLYTVDKAALELEGTKEP